MSEHPVQQAEIPPPTVEELIPGMEADDVSFITQLKGLAQLGISSEDDDTTIEDVLEMAYSQPIYTKRWLRDQQEMREGSLYKAMELAAKVMSSGILRRFTIDTTNLRLPKPTQHAVRILDRDQTFRKLRDQHNNAPSDPYYFQLMQGRALTCLVLMAAGKLVGNEPFDLPDNAIAQLRAYNLGRDT